MFSALVFLVAASGLGAAAQPAGCDLRPGTYEEWVAAKPRAVKDAAATADSDGHAPNRPYDGFFRALANAEVEPAALQACCAAAAPDRVGALSCSFTAYIARGRVDSSGFLTAFPATAGEVSLLWDLDALVAAAAEAGVPMPEVFRAKKPSERLIEELFLLVLDDKEDAVARFFTMASAAPESAAPVVDSRIELMLREAPAVLVTNWLAVRKHRRKLQAVARSMRSRISAEERASLASRIEVFCGSRTDPYCREILSLVGGK